MLGYKETRNQPIYINLKSEESSNLQQQKEQIMKYKGITIHKNSNCDTWYTRIRKNGKQYYISAKTQKDCYNKLKKAFNEELETKVETKIPTLFDWYNKWLELYKIGKVKQSTIEDYKSTIKNIQQLLEIEIDKIKVEDILKELNSINAERQRQKAYELLKVLFDKALINEVITKNIMLKIERPEHEKDHGQALTNKQQEELINTCKNIENADIILIAMYQGLRRGEVLGLTTDNIDYENNTLTIDKAFNKYNKFDTTKNKQSIRTMPLFDESKKILMKYKNQKERIFDLTNKQYELLLNKIKSECKIENLKMKDMRSTFITRCKEFNIPKHVIQAWVGHKIGSQITDVVYTKHNTEMDNKYVNILNNSKFYSNSTHEK